MLEKYAARMGGAQNHRMRLDDGVLIKDNHVAVCGGVAEAVRRAKAANTGLQVQVEVDRIDQIEPALAAGADRLLLDNMDPPMLREAVALVAGRVPLEASGGVDSRNHPRHRRDRRRLHFGRPDHPVRAGGRHRARLCAESLNRGTIFIDMTALRRSSAHELVCASPRGRTRSIEEYFDEEAYCSRPLHRRRRPSQRRHARAGITTATGMGVIPTITTAIGIVITMAVDRSRNGT